MRVIRHDGAEERHAVVAMVLSDAVLGSVAPLWQRDSFGSRWGNLIADWCVDHWQKYQQAPGAAGITSRFDLWKETADDSFAQTVSDWLTNLPAESGLNDDYAIDTINNIVQKQSLKRLGQGITSLIENGKLEDALNLQASWKRPKVGEQEAGVFPLQDAKVIEDAFSYANREPLIKYPGALGEFFGDIFSADSFVSFLAPEKTGKTTVLLDLAWRAVSQNKRVALFSCGDMSQAQMILRLAPRLCRKPLKGGTFHVPSEVVYKDKEPTVKWEARTAQPITKDEAIAAFQQSGQADPTRFRLLTYPAGTITAADISAMAQRWADEGWMPDVFVIDYADILAGPRGYKEPRDQINANWEELRALSTRTRSLVVTATQSDTEGYSAWLLSKKNFSDCKKKIAHVTAMVGLNMTEQERRMGVCRYNYVALREAEFMQGRPNWIAVAGCTKVGRPSLLSAWGE